MYFCMPSELLVPFSTIVTQHTDFTFCINLVPTPKSLNTKIENFLSISSSSEVPYKVFELLLNTLILTDRQMQTNVFSHLPLDPKYSSTQKQCNDECK